MSLQAARGDALLALMSGSRGKVPVNLLRLRLPLAACRLTCGPQRHLHLLESQLEGTQGEGRRCLQRRLSVCPSHLGGVSEASDDYQASAGRGHPAQAPRPPHQPSLQLALYRHSAARSCHRQLHALPLFLQEHGCHLPCRVGPTRTCEAIASGFEDIISHAWLTMEVMKQPQILKSFLSTL